MLVPMKKSDVEKVTAALPEIARDTIRGKNVCLAGGFIRDTLLDRKPEDLDLFVFGKRDNRRDIAIRIISRYQHAGYLMERESPMAFTLTHPNRMTIQIVFGIQARAPVEIVRDFDFALNKKVIFADAGAFIGLMDPRNPFTYNGRREWQSPSRHLERLVRFARMVPDAEIPGETYIRLCHEIADYKILKMGLEKTEPEPEKNVINGLDLLKQMEQAEQERKKEYSGLDWSKILNFNALHTRPVVITPGTDDDDSDEDDIFDFQGGDDY